MNFWLVRRSGLASISLVPCIASVHSLSRAWPVLANRVTPNTIPSIELCILQGVSAGLPDATVLDVRWYPADTSSGWSGHDVSAWWKSTQGPRRHVLDTDSSAGHVTTGERYLACQRFGIQFSYSGTSAALYSRGPAFYITDRISEALDMRQVKLPKYR